MSPVADAPINLSDRVVSRAMSRVAACASQAAFGTHGFSQDWTGWTVWPVALPDTEALVFTAPGEAFASSWFRPSLDGMSRVLRLTHGWDTYNARPISHRSATSALSFLGDFLESRSAAPAVVPLADGGVQLEWHRGGLDVEIAFSPGEDPEMYVADHESGREWELDPRSGEIEDIRPLLHRLRAD